MRYGLSFGLAIAFFGLSSTAFAAKTNFTTTLDGVLAEPPVATTGSGKFTYDTDTKRLCGTLTFEPLTGPITSAELARVSNKAVVAPVTGFPSPMPVNVIVTEQDATNLNGGVFINLKTQTHPNGEINGVLYFAAAGEEQTCQVLPEPDAGSNPPPAPPPDDTGNTGDTNSGSTDGLTNDKDPPKKAPPKDEGCAATPGGGTGDGLAFAGVVGLAFALTRARRRR